MTPVGGQVTVAGLLVGAVTVLVAVAAVVQLIACRVRHRHNEDRTGSPILQLYAVCVLTCVPVIWMGSHIDDGLRMLYLSLMWAAPMLLLGTTWWWVCATVRTLSPQALSRGLQGLRRRLSLCWWVVPPAVVAALFAGVTIWHTAPSGDDPDGRGPVAQARSMVPSMVTALDRPGLQGRPVVVKWSGVQSWASVGPALESALIARGRHVYYDVVWPYPEYDEFRRVAHAPNGAVVVSLRERSGPGAAWSLTDAPPASKILTFAETAGDGSGQLQMLILKAPFSRPTP
ncbi:hypothetical protein [Leekyejoonella antrihumi]|uniref:Uncharacterized protein n=1 Tax=Leekyejoonella antrihumi TaxID=1660198 RepID=A0A563DVH9_9MICO|nr:hypothetical protein [Leekyejoonella antrihumi]TWP34195.1 hypothetical protein FGL98_18205 [Leekyejoonella antrihumi]